MTGGAVTDTHLKFVWVLTIFLASVSLAGSGYYVPFFKASKLDTPAVKDAKKVLSEPAVFSSKNMSCLSCHDPKAAVPFKRRKLYKKRRNLLDQVNRCIVEPDRLAGQPIDKNDQRYLDVLIYLSARYRITF